MIYEFCIVFHVEMMKRALQFSSVPRPTGSWGVGEEVDMTDNSTEILFQCFLQEVTVSSSDKGRDAHSLRRHCFFLNYALLKIWLTNNEPETKSYTLVTLDTESFSLFKLIKASSKQ